MDLDPKAVDAAHKLKRNLANMLRARERFAAASKKFQILYFNWCLGECKAELARDFSLVRMVQDTSACIFFSFIEALTPKEKEAVVIALCKAMHDPESLSELEAQIYKRYRQHWSMPFNLQGRVVSALRTTPHQLEIQQRFVRQHPSKRIIAQLLRKTLKAIAVQDFGQLLEDKSSILVYEKPIGAWYVVTTFELLTHWQLRYCHHIHALSGATPESKIYSGISVLNWTGIHADSTWSWLLPEDIPSAVNAVYKICMHFLENAEGLLGDLTRGT